MIYEVLVASRAAFREIDPLGKQTSKRPRYGRSNFTSEYATRANLAMTAVRALSSIPVLTVWCDIPRVLVAEGILAHPDGANGCLPERATHTGVSVLRQALMAPRYTRLRFGEVKPAVLEKPLVVEKAAQITGIRQDDQSDDRSDAGDLG